MNLWGRMRPDCPVPNGVFWHSNKRQATLGIQSRRDEIEERAISDVLESKGYRSWTRSSVFSKRFWLEIDPRRQLKRPRAARAEHLSEPGSRLPEAGTGEITAVAGEVGGIVQVEHLADQR
jgi:hypothetical protein